MDSTDDDCPSPGGGTYTNTPGSIDDGVAEVSSDEAAAITNSGRLSCENYDSQPLASVPVPDGLVQPLGGTASTHERHTSTYATGNEVERLLDSLMQRDDLDCDVITETGVVRRHAVCLHLMQTNINNPGAVSLGGQVILTPPEEETQAPVESHSTKEIQRLRSETEGDLEKWTEGMVKTRATQTVLDKIAEGMPWITITGSPGEGKTTVGYLALKHLHNMGREVYVIKTPQDYFKVKDVKRPILMLNDIFGSLYFQLDHVKKWEEVLGDVLGLEEHRKRSKKEARERKKARLTVIFICRSSILKASSSHLGRFRDSVLNDNCVADLSHGLDLTEEERIKIWKCHFKECNMDSRIINEVCKISLPHGFPHCCRLFADMYSRNMQLSVISFFSKPIQFLNQTVLSLMEDDVTSSLLKEMLKNDGSLELESVTDGEKRCQYIKDVKILEGTYLVGDHDRITFHHPSVYDSVAFVACEQDPRFVIKYCTLSFLNERVVFKGFESGRQQRNEQKVEVDKELVPKFLGRLKAEIEDGNICQSLCHQLFHNDDFVSDFMQLILASMEIQGMSDPVRKLIQTRDSRTCESFLFLMTKSGSNNILEYVCQNIELSVEDQKQTLFGICEHASSSSLEYILGKFRNLNLNAEISDLGTPLLIASRKASGDFLQLLLAQDDIDVSITDRRGNSALHNICRYGVEGDRVVQMLIEKGADVHMASLEYPFLPLNTACYEGHRLVVSALIECQANVNKRDSNGGTPLTHACSRRHEDVVTILLNSKADINMPNSDGDTPLHVACVRGHDDVVTVLLNRDGDINIMDRSGNTPLHAACFAGHANIVTIFLTHGVDVNAKNRDDDRPLHAASLLGHVNVVMVLLERGADINKEGRLGDTCLHRACYKWYENVFTVLLDNGANINMGNKDGDTPLHRACYTGPLEVVTALLHKRAEVNITNKNGDTPLHKTCDWAHVDAVSVLLDNGADINKRNNDGDTLLHNACLIRRMDIISVLLNRGADMNIVNNFGDKTLHTASYEGHLDVVAFLLDRGALINMKNTDGNTPLHEACREGHADVGTFLLDRGALTNIQNTDGNTPLHEACLSGNVHVGTTLLDRGALIDIQNTKGNTPLHEACLGRKTDFVSVLLDREADVTITNSKRETALDVARSFRFWGNAGIEEGFSLRTFGV